MNSCVQHVRTCDQTHKAIDSHQREKDVKTRVNRDQYEPNNRQLLTIIMVLLNYLSKQPQIAKPCTENNMHLTICCIVAKLHLRRKTW